MKPLLTLALLLVTACQALPREPVTLSRAEASPTSAASPEADATAVRIRASGGMCPAGMCETTTVVRADGRYTRAFGKNPPTEGRVDAGLAAAVAREAATADFRALMARPFTGTCPTAYDGQEFFYTFPTAPGGPTVGSCQVAIDWAHPLFAALKRLEAALAAS